MRIVLLCNNWTGWQITRWLSQRPEEIVGLVIHPPKRSRYRDEITREAGVAGRAVFDATQIHEPQAADRIRALEPDIGVSAFWGYCLRPEFLELFPAGCVNVHPAFLPYNRGAYPNVWSILDGTPAGVTLHYMDNGIDTGDIIAQREIPVEPVDTGASLYGKLERACVELFTETWPSIRDGTAPRRPQSAESATSHRVRDVDSIDEIDLDRNYKARNLIDLVRARTFPPFHGAYFKQNGRRVYVRMQLECEDVSRKDDPDGCDLD